MSQAIDLPLTDLGLEMMFLGPTSVWHHRLCGPWGKLEASALFFKGNQGIDRPSSTKTTASPASLHFNVSAGAERSVNIPEGFGRHGYHPGIHPRSATRGWTQT